MKVVNCELMKWNEYEIVLLAVTILLPLKIVSIIVSYKGFVEEIKFESINVLEVTLTELKLI